MELSQAGLALLFAASVACGFIMGAAYDIFAILPSLCGRVSCKRLHLKLSGIKRPLRLGVRGKRFRKSALGVSVFLHDLIMALISGVMLVLVIYRFNDGQFRASAPAGFIAGMLLYRCTLRRVIAPLPELVGFAAGYALSCLAFCVAAPTRQMLRMVIRMISSARKRLYEKRIKKQSDREKVYLLSLARQNGCLGITGEGKNGKKKEKHGSCGSACGASVALADRYGNQRDAV